MTPPLRIRLEQTSLHAMTELLQLHHLMEKKTLSGVRPQSDLELGTEQTEHTMLDPPLFSYKKAQSIAYGCSTLQVSCGQQHSCSL